MEIELFLWAWMSLLEKKKNKQQNFVGLTFGAQNQPFRDL